jgi:hypothetical protein
MYNINNNHKTNKDNMDDCRYYTLNTLQNGKPGYLTGCQNSDWLGADSYDNQNCASGYTEVGKCSGKWTNCRNKCGDSTGTPDAPLCTGDGSRKICKKNLSAYKPIKDGNAYDKCCTVTDAGIRESNDCPMTYKPDSTACTDVLLEKCVDDKDLSKITDYSCAVLATNKTYSIKSKYDKAASQYCDVDENLKSEFCLNWCKDNKSKCIQKLRDVCFDKKDDPSFKSVCACYYPQTFYDEINKEIGDVWNVPSRYMNSNPECMFPQCQVSELRNTNVVCPDISFVKCINEQNFNLTNSTVDGVTIKQGNDCGKSFKKVQSDDSAGNNQSFNEHSPGNNVPPPPPPPPPPKPAADDVPPDDIMATLKENKILVFVFIMFIFVVIFMMANGGGGDYDDRYYDDDRYDDDIGRRR